MLNTKDVEERGSKRFIKCTLTMNPATLQLDDIGDNFDADPSMLRQGRGRDRSETISGHFFSQHITKERPDLLDPFSGAVFEDPVIAEDGKSYERYDIERWFAQAKKAGALFVRLRVASADSILTCITSHQRCPDNLSNNTQGDGRKACRERGAQGRDQRLAH